MLNKIIFKVIKSVVLFLKKINLKKFLFDKLIFNIGLNQILENKKNYQNVTYISETELKIFSQNPYSIVLALNQSLTQSHEWYNYSPYLLQSF